MLNTIKKGHFTEDKHRIMDYMKSEPIQHEVSEQFLEHNRMAKYHVYF